MDNPFDEETEYFMRLVLLINEKGVEACRESLLHFSTLKYGTRTFDDVLHDANAKRVLHTLKGPGRGKPITAQQWLLLYPGTGTVDVTQLDITLCLLLLRNICGLREPSTTWDKPPAPTDNSLEGGLAQLKHIRNIISHCNQPKLCDADFNTHFQNACDAILNIEKDLPKWSITVDTLRRYDKGPISRALYDDLSHVIQEWAQQDKDLKTEIGAVKAGIDTLQTKFEKFEAGKRKCPDEETLPPDYCRQLQECLKTLYKKKMGYIGCNPVNPTATRSINKLFVDVALSVKEVDYPAGRKGKKKPLETYFDIFESVSEVKKGPLSENYVDQNDIKAKTDGLRIVIQGDPGMGKTTFTKSLAFDWAEGKESKVSENFENVFVLTLREVKERQTLVDAITEQLFPRESPLIPYLKTYIEQSKKCLFLFDGLDEMKPNTSEDIESMIKGRYLRDNCLVITSRPAEAEHLKTHSKVDTFFRLKGFTEKKVLTYIKQYFDEENAVSRAEIEGRGPSNSNMVKDLFKEIQSKGLLDVVANPLVLNILCLLHANNRSLCAKDISTIYREIVNFLYKRQRDEDTESEPDLENIGIELGRVAFDSLFKENQLNASRKTIPKVLGEDAMRVGMVWTERGMYELSDKVKYLHKSIQEYLAASYVGKQSDLNNDEPWEKLKLKLKTIREIGEEETLLQFCAGASERLAGLILSLLDEKVGEIDPKLTSVFRSIDQLLQKENMDMSEIEPVFKYVTMFKLKEQVKFILRLEAKCLQNIDKTTETRNSIVRKLIRSTKSVHIVANNKELQLLDSSGPSLRLIKLEGKCTKPFVFEETTAMLLKKVLNNVEHNICVSIGRYCRVEFPIMLMIIHLLKQHPKVKFKQLTCYESFSRNASEWWDWEIVFQTLLGSQYLIGLNLSFRGFPKTVLTTLGQIINQNAATLLQLELSGNTDIQNSFGQLSQEIKSSLALVVLNLSECCKQSDKYAASHMLMKCNCIEVLNIWGCECEISNAILTLKHLRELIISHSVSSDSEGGLNVEYILGNLDKFEKLEVFEADNCEINNRQVQKIPLESPSNIREISLRRNHIGNKGLKHFCEHHNALPNLQVLGLARNKIEDKGGRKLVKSVDSFKSIRTIELDGNRLNASLMVQIKRKLSSLQY